MPVRAAPLVPLSNYSLRSWDVDHDCTPDFPPTPFASFIRPLPSHLQGSRNMSFTLFSELPAELQDMIARACDPDTLWQLMRVNHFLRAAASKCFWRHPLLWHEIDETFFSSCQHNCPKSCISDPSFGHSIEQIWLSQPNWVSPFDESIRWARHLDSLDAKLQYWWSKVLERFPLVQHVILGSIWTERNPTGSIVAPNGRVWTRAEWFVRSAPPGLTVTLALSNHRNVPALKHRFWTFDEVEKQWKLLPLGWHEYKRIVIPKRLPASGLLRTFEAMLFTHDLLRSEEATLKALVTYGWMQVFNVSTPKHWKCPDIGCGFETSSGKSDVIDHLAWNHVQELYTDSLHWPDYASPQATDFITERQTRIETLRQRWQNQWLRIREQLGAVESREWNEFTERFDREVVEVLFPLSTTIDAEVEQVAYEDKFWSFFDPEHYEYCPAIPQYDTT